MVLSSSQILRKLFQKRWTKESGKDWKHTEAQGQEFIQGLGQRAFNRTQSNDQKELIANGCLEAWDVSLLAAVLLNFGNWNQYKTETEAVHELKTMRNYTAHHPTKKLTLKEYNEKMDVFQSNLKKLSVEEEVIDQLITKAGLSSSVAAMKACKKLYEKAKILMKKNEFENAISCYEEAITMPSLIPIHQSAAYEKRAECYVKFAEHKKNEQLETQVDLYCDQAVKDATQVLEINESSWNAHFILAQAHRLKKNLDKAMDHYDQSLALSPQQQHVRNEKDCCIALLSIQNGGITHLNPNTLPMNLTEKVAQYSKKLGRQLTEEEFLRDRGVPESVSIAGQDYLAKGHQYRCGWGVPINEVEAVRYFTKSAEAGNPEGMHSLEFATLTVQVCDKTLPKVTICILRQLTCQQVPVVEQHLEARIAVLPPPNTLWESCTSWE